MVQAHRHERARRAVRTTLLTAAALLFGTLAVSALDVAGAAEGHQTVTLRGFVREIAPAAPDTPAGSMHEHHQTLDVGEQSYDLVGADVPANAEVRVTGTVDGESGTLAVESTEILATAPVTVLPTEGTLDTLYLRAYWTQPDDMTEAELLARIAGDDTWFREVSYGQLGQTGAVTPWMRIAGPEGGKCFNDGRRVWQQAKDAATALGYDLADYTNYVVYHPKAAPLPTGTDCPNYYGWAEAGGDDATINGRPSDTGATNQRSLEGLTTHELGHNLGLKHADFNGCTEVIGGSCEYRELRDRYSTMGNSLNGGHYSAAEKDRLGWLGDGRLADLTAGGAATIVPMSDGGSGVHAVEVAASGQRTYWLEYRQLENADAQLPAVGTDGVQLRVTGAGSGAEVDYAAVLLDAHPDDGSDFESNPSLQGGRSWTTPEGFHIAVGSVTPDGAQVTVTAPPVIESLDGVGYSETTAYVVGRVNLSVFPSATRTIRYGTTTGYGSTVTDTITGARHADGTYEVLSVAPLTGLEPRTTYHYSVTVTTPYASVTSPDKTFVTAGPPRITAQGSWEHEGGGQSLLGMAEIYTDSTATATLRWGSTNGDDSSRTVWLTSPDTALSAKRRVSFNEVIDGLTPGATYHWSVTITTAHGSVTSEEQTFVVSGPPRINAVTNLEMSGGGQLVLGNADLFTATSATQTVRWGPTSAYGSSKSKTLSSGSGRALNNVIINEVIDGLSPGVTYHWSVSIESVHGSVTSEDRTFVAR